MVNVANVYQIPALMDTPQIGGVIIDNFRSRMVSNTDMIELAQNKPAKQIKMNDLNQQMIVNPDSVDVHDITIGMAEASLSLKLAQTVIDRIVKSWNDITITR